MTTSAPSIPGPSKVKDISTIMSAAAEGDSGAARELLPLVYEELRRLANQKMAKEKAGQTLNATALVHEAYMRMVGPDGGPNWDNRGHFFAAAAESMRRILVENAQEITPQTRRWSKSGRTRQLRRFDDRQAARGTGGS